MLESPGLRLKRNVNLTVIVPPARQRKSVEMRVRRGRDRDNEENLIKNLLLEKESKKHAILDTIL
jgi:hypothetical protein